MKNFKLKLLALLTMVLVTATTMGQGYYYTNLASATTQIGKNVWVRSFHKYSNYGGGYFIWVAGNNTGITNIPGIRVKPTGVTEGYWVRCDLGSTRVDWFGATCTNQTWTALGVSQGTLDSWYGAGFATTSDTPDRTAINYAFKLMETAGYTATEFSPRKYYVNNTCNLPTVRADGTDGENFLIEGKNAEIQTTNSTEFTVFKTHPNSQTQASTYITRSIWLDKMTVIMTGGLQTGFDISATYMSKLDGLRTRFGNVGYRFNFSMGFTLTNFVAHEPDSAGVVVDMGNWTGMDGTGTDANSNVSAIRNGKVRFDGGTGIAGVIWRGSDSGKIEDVIIEGNNSIVYGVFVNNAFSPTIKKMTIRGIHAELSITHIIYFRANDGQLTVDDLWSQYDGNLVTVNNDGAGSYPLVTITNLQTVRTNHKFCNLNGGGCSWVFWNCNIPGIQTAANLLAATSRWDLTIIGSTIPNSSRLVYTKTSQS